MSAVADRPQRTRPPETNAEKQLRGSAEPQPGACGAQLRGTSPPRYCTRPPVRGRGRCRTHGGLTPVGPASPHFKTGQWSSYFSVAPESLKKHFRGKSAVSQMNEIALMDARVTEVLSRLRDHDPARATKRMSDAIDEMREAINAGNTAMMSNALIAIEKELKPLRVEAASWQEIRATLDTRDKLARTEIAFQRLQSERILVDNIENFIQVLVIEARELGLARDVLSRYVQRVIDAAKRHVLPALPSDTEAVDGEVVE